MTTAAVTATAPGLARKLKKVLETRTDSPELLASLATLSTFYTENTAQTRRNLRATIEKRGLAINDEFLLAAESAQKTLDAVELEVASLAECCDRIAKSLSTCSATTGEIVTATERLKLELENATQRQELIANFLHNYQLSPEEVFALREEDLSENFFKALTRVQEIHANCKVLLRTHHQRAGLELMDMMAVYQEGAYERLCRWVQAECRSLGDNDTPEVSDLLKTAAAALKDRPVLFKYCVEEVANTRHNALFRRFISALTRGGPGGMPRPIEVHAPDPLRYVGDMLAWLHQALASERDLALALFTTEASLGSVSRKNSLDGSASRRFSKELDRETGKPETDMGFVLDRVFEGVCRPFRVRVEQVLQSQPGLLLAYKLTNLLEFYSHTISDLLGHGAVLSSTVRDVRDSAQQTFFDIMKVHGDKLLRYPTPVAVDLSPPPAVGDGVSLLLELIDTHEKIMVSAGGKKPDFDPIISAILDPLKEMCERAAESYAGKPQMAHVRRLSGSGLESGRRLANFSGPQRRTSSVETILAGSNMSIPAQGVAVLRRIFLINCFSAMQQPLLSHDVGAGYVQLLGNLIEGHITALVDQESTAILERCGLQRKLQYLAGHPPTAASALPGILSKENNIENNVKAFVDNKELSPEMVGESLRLFFSMLAAGDGAVREFEQIQVPQLRSETSSRVAKALADAYETFYTAIFDHEHGYPDLKSVFRHTPEQVRTMLGI